MYKYIGSWSKAVQLAGVRYETKQRRWTNDSVLCEIRRLHGESKSLSSSQVENALVAAAIKRFGSWRKARAAAVPSYDKSPEEWTRKKILDAIAELHARGVSLSSKHLEDIGRGKLVSAAIKRFGSWQAARRRVVKDFEPLIETWSKQRVLRRIRERDKQGKSMSATSVGLDDLRLHAAARRYFGSWKVARAAAGVPYKDPRHRWTDERIVAELRRHAVDGIRPTSTEVGHALYRAASLHFGGFERACRAAGLRPRPRHRRVSRKHGRHK